MGTIEYIFLGLALLLGFGLIDFLIREIFSDYFCRNCYKLKPKGKRTQEDSYCSKECCKGD